MNFDNNEDALEFINRLLERLHQADYINQGSKIEVVYVASGGQHVETQINIGAHPNEGSEKEAKDNIPPPDGWIKNGATAQYAILGTALLKELQ